LIKIVYFVGQTFKLLIRPDGKNKNRKDTLLSKMWGFLPFPAA